LNSGMDIKEVDSAMAIFLRTVAGLAGRG